MNKRLRLSLAAGFTLITAGIAYWMIHLHQQEELWGHWPLGLFLAGWSSIFLWTARKTLNDRRGIRWFIMATSGAALLSLGFPPLPFTPLMFLGFVPLFWLSREILEATDIEKPRRRLFKYGYHFFVTWNILTTFWVANTAFVAGIFAIFVNALFMCVPLLLTSWTLKRMPRFGFLIFLSYWLSFEYLHLRWEISWPWLTLGNAFAEYPSWVQWYSFTGVFGGSLWILLANLLLFQFLWKRKKEGRLSVLPSLLRFGGLIVVPVVLSLIQYSRFDPEQGEGVEVVVVQPNYEPHYQKFDIPEQEQLDHFLSLSAKALSDKTEYLVFPETSFGAIQDRQLGTEPLTRQLKDFTDARPGLKLISGLTVYHVFEEGEPLTGAVRERDRGNGNIFRFEMINAAVQFTAGQEEVPVYKKSKLVPGAEFLPYRKLFFFLKPLVDKLEGSMAGYGAQEKRSAFESENGQLVVGPAICYESIYGEYYGGYVRAGKANMTFIMTNDGWWDNTAGHKQHLKFASLRAIETRRPIARSANTGISGFINARGDIFNETKYGEEAAVAGTIYPSDEATFYLRHGDLIGRISLFLTALFLLNSLVRQLTPEKSKE
ncbi:MAG: apolipoprotein N-acyltransferase [Bacteroidetes bacterium]|nr:apolipoprotein N-acyltransferase [Bacteroidota bacterium]